LKMPENWVTCSKDPLAPSQKQRAAQMARRLKARLGQS
jgi:hypothetical protein